MTKCGCLKTLFACLCIAIGTAGVVLVLASCCRGADAPPADAWRDGQAMAQVDGRPFIVYATATWCLPCRQIEPLIPQLQALGHFYRLDVDREATRARQSGIRREVPALIFFRYDRESKQWRGRTEYIGVPAIRQMLESGRERRTVGFKAIVPIVAQWIANVPAAERDQRGPLISQTLRSAAGLIEREAPGWGTPVEIHATMIRLLAGSMGANAERRAPLWAPLFCGINETSDTLRSTGQLVTPWDYADFFLAVAQGIDGSGLFPPAAAARSPLPQQLGPLAPCRQRQQVQATPQNYVRYGGGRCSGGG